jgi:PKD repeat protein
MAQSWPITFGGEYSTAAMSTNAPPGTYEVHLVVQGMPITRENVKVLAAVKLLVNAP